MKRFNTTAVCVPSKHYMVDLTDRINAIKELVDAGMYFTINRARQYGKTTTLNALKQVLKNEYVVVGLSFEALTNANFSDEHSFVKAFCRLFKKNLNFYRSIPEQIRLQMDDFLDCKEDKASMDELFITLNEWCAISELPIVLLIDEVDSATNNQIFIDFLGLLRDGYISRDSDEIPTFHSVILAGVTDVKHLKSKIRPEENGKENSPWNISSDFNIDMSLSESGIKGITNHFLIAVINQLYIILQISYLLQSLIAFCTKLTKRLCDLHFNHNSHFPGLVFANCNVCSSVSVFAV